MPESKGRKTATEKKKEARLEANTAARSEKKRRTPSLTNTRAWVAPTFITLMLLGVMWLIVWYITAATGTVVPYMSDLGQWNLIIGMGLMVAGFGVSTLWK